jgi:hypothetical protein
MAMDIGDAVLTFVGDTTQLDQAFTKVQTDAKTKLEPAAESAKKVGTEIDKTATSATTAGATMSSAWQRVAQATIVNEAAQKQLAVAMETVKKTGGDDVIAMLALAEAQKNAAKASLELTTAQRAAQASIQQTTKVTREATGELALTGDLTGVVIPRHLRTMIAELPGVGAALEAAFAVTGVLIFAQILIELEDKLIEFTRHGEEMRQKQIEVDHTFSETSTHMEEGLEKSKQKYIELTQGPLAAFIFEMNHQRSTAEATWSAMSTDIDKFSAHFQEESSKWNPFNLYDQASRMIQAYKADVTAAIDKQKELESSLKPEFRDPTAEYRAGLRKTDEEIGKVNDRLAELHEDEQTMFRTFGFSTIDTKPYEDYLTRLKQLRHDFQTGLETDDQNAKNKQAEEARTAAAKALSEGSAEIEGRKRVNTARISLEQELNSELFARGQISRAQELQAERDFQTQLDALALQSAQRKLGLLNRDPVTNKAAIITANKEIEALQIEHETNMAKIDQKEYAQRMSDFDRFMGALIAGTKQGSQERVELEQGRLEFYKSVYGAESEAYLAQNERVKEASQQRTQQLRREALEQSKVEQDLALDKLQANSQYYQYLYQTARIGSAQLLRISQEEAAESYRIRKEALEKNVQAVQAAVAEDYRLRRDALNKELSELGPNEVAARKRVNDELAALSRHEADAKVAATRQANAEIKTLDQQEEERKRLAAAQTADILESYYKDLGIKSAESYERQAVIAKEAYDKIAASGSATYEELLRGQIKVLEATIAWKEASGLDTTADRETLDRLTNSQFKLKLAMDHTNQAGNLMKVIFKQLGIETKLMGSTIANVSLLVAGAAAAMAMAWSAGGVSVAQAAERMAAAILQSVAQYAFVKAIEQLALGFAAMSPTSPDFGHSGEHFTSAALWFAVGAGASIAAGAINNAASGGSGSSGGPDQPETTQAPGIQQGPTQAAPTTQNVQTFAEGGITLMDVVHGNRPGIGGPRSPKLAIYDEGDTPEAHIPAPGGSVPLIINPDGTVGAALPGGRQLPAHVTGTTDSIFSAWLTQLSGLSVPHSNSNAPDQFRFATGGLIGEVTAGAAVSPISAIHTLATKQNAPADGLSQAALEQIDAVVQSHVQAAGGIKVYVEGMISPDNLNKVIKKIDRAVRNNDAQLTSSNTYRLTKKG